MASGHRIIAAKVALKVRERIDKVARAEDLTRSQWIRRVVLAALANQEKGAVGA